MKNKQSFRAIAYKFLFLTTFFTNNFVSAQFGMLPNSRMAQVTYKGYGGIEAANHKIKFAETKNLKFDLNLSEISSRFGCKTKMGQDFIAFSLDKVISSKDQNHTIEHRQKLIKTLIDQPELLVKLQNLVKQVADDHEAAVTQFMAKRFVMDHKEFTENPFRFVYHWMGQSTIWQTYSLWLSATTVLNPLVVAPLNKAWNYAQPFVEGKKPFSAYDEIASVYNKSTDFSQFDAGSFVSNSVYAMLNLGAPGESAIANTQKMWGIILAGISLYDHYTDAVEKRNALYSLHKLVETAQEIEEICTENNIEHQFKASAVRSRMGQYLLDELALSRYQDKESSMFLTTAVKTFIYEVYEHDNHFAPIYASIAEMDAYVAIASKMVELQNTDHQYCFAQFLDLEQPTIQAQGFWNVLVPTDKVVTNNIAEHRNIILTGSNEGGKTTVIRAILQNIVLAQTFGIAAATEFKLTHFDVIHSFLNVSDDILNGKSRFASELKQAQDILKRIQGLQSGEKFFFAFDELFTGTNGEDGAQCAYQFINNIASYKGIQFIYATHFNVLKTIGAHNPACANYKIEPPLRNKQGKFIRDEKGQLIYPYKLSPGANDVNVAMDRARDAGIFA
jgi:MutS domain V